MNDEYLAEGHADGRPLTWARLIDDHDEIDRRCRALLDLVESAGAEPEHAAVLLLRLSILVTDHLAIEGEVVDMTMAAMRAGRSHSEIDEMQATLDRLKRDWTRYLAYWSFTTISDGWDAFVAETRAMLRRLSTQVMQENDILYAHALSHHTIDLGVAAFH